jgi:hypothetical protein
LSIGPKAIYLTTSLTPSLNVLSFHPSPKPLPKTTPIIPKSNSNTFYPNPIISPIQTNHSLKNHPTYSSKTNLKKTQISSKLPTYPT